MESKGNILQETRQISQTVAGIGNRNVYSVPAGYFDDLPVQVLAQLTAQQMPAAPAPFSVPAGYFDDLAGNIMARIKGRQAATDKGFFTQAGETALPPYLPTPYNVPGGYFSSLSENILTRIKLEEDSFEIEEQLIPAGLSTPYSVPGTYFSSLSEDIMAKIRQEESVFETDEQLIPAALPAPYSVPAGYFDSLSEGIMAKIREPENAFEAEEQLIPAALPTPYAVPAGYFNSLAGNIMAAIHVQQHASGEVYDELQEIAPILNTISRQTPYSVPAGYFKQLEVSMPAEQEEPTAKVVSMRNSRVSYMRYAAAACVAILLGIGGYWFVRPGNVKTDDKNFERMVAGLSTADINAYLASQAPATIDVVPTAVDEQATDIQEDINETSTQEIQQYLQDNSEPDEKGGKDI